MPDDATRPTLMTASVITDAVSELHIIAADPPPPSTSPSTVESCRFLEKIPAEIRNDIYQLAFTPDHDTEKEVDLFKAAPPRKSILSTCRQVYEEAREYYIEAYRDYWQETEFYVDCEGPPRPRQWYGKDDYFKATDEVELVSFCADDVNHIRKISVIRTDYEGGEVDVYVLYKYLARDATWLGVQYPEEILVFRSTPQKPGYIRIYYDEADLIPPWVVSSKSRRVPFHLQLACLIWYFGSESIYLSEVAVDTLPVWGRRSRGK